MRIKNVALALEVPKKSDFLMQFAVLILILSSILVIVSTSIGGMTKDPCIIPKALAKQLFLIVVFYVLMTFFASDFTAKCTQKLFPVFGIGIIVTLFSTRLFEDALGSRAWIRIPVPGLGEMTTQPSELAKVHMVAVMAVFVELMARRRKFKFQVAVHIPIYFFMVIVAAILLQKGSGAFPILILPYVTCLLIPSRIGLYKQQRWVRLGLIVRRISIVLIISESIIDFLNGTGPLQHVVVRIESTLNPFTSPHNGGYRLINGLCGFARSGFTGVGLGNPAQKYGYLTQSDNDFILSTIVKKLRISGLMVAVLGYVVVLQRLFYYTFHTENENYKVILVGTTMYILVHFALSVDGVSGLTLLTGVPLLFVSSGESSLISIMTAIDTSQSVISRMRRQGSVTVSTITKQLPHT